MCVVLVIYNNILYFNIPAGSNSRARSKSHFYINIASLPSETSPPPSAESSGEPSPNAILDQVGGDVGKPKGNTLLHLFGGWLFSAAIWPRRFIENYSSLLLGPAYVHIICVTS